MWHALPLVSPCVRHSPVEGTVVKILYLRFQELLFLRLVVAVKLSLAEKTGTSGEQLKLGHGSGCSKTGNFTITMALAHFRLGDGTRRKKVCQSSPLSVLNCGAVLTGSVSFNTSLPAGDVAPFETRRLCQSSGLRFCASHGRSGRTNHDSTLLGKYIEQCRLLPQKSWSSVHEFSSNCSDPIIRQNSFIDRMPTERRRNVIGRLMTAS